MVTHQWVFPFGYPRIKACLQLPEDYRSLPRPSSPLGTKASALSPYSLDHIILSNTKIIYFNYS